MNIITISREFGSGGRELGKRLADLLGFAYYDKEMISAIAESLHLNTETGDGLENHIHYARSYPVRFGRSFSSSFALQPESTHLLLEQTQVIKRIAQIGTDCVIVGRNAGIILGDKNPFNLFVCADMESKIRRCQERQEEGENLSEKEILHHIRRIDKNRARTRVIISGDKWDEKNAYHMIVNTTDWEIKELTPAVADFIRHWLGRKGNPSKK